MKLRLPAQVTATLAIVAVLFSGVVVGIEISDDGNIQISATVQRAVQPEKTVDVKVPGPDQQVTLDADQERDAEDVDQSLSTPIGEGLDLHEDAVDETPPGISAEDVARGYDRAEDVNEDVLRPPTEPAGAQGYDCRDRPVSNQSALSSRRYGVALHFTVSSFGSINGIYSIFNRPSFGASSNYGYEIAGPLAGQCQRWVSDGRKAWAQGAFNSAYISIEIITNDLSRAQWLAAPEIRNGHLAQLVADLLHKTGAPPQRRDPSGCTPLAGVVDHDSLECGNSHWDVGPGFPWDVFIGQVRRAYRGVPVSPLTKREQVLVARLKAGTNPRRTCRLAKAQLRRLHPPYKVRHRGARRQLLVKPYAKRCR